MSATGDGATTPATAAPAATRAATADDHWALHGQVQSMQVAINQLVTTFMETTRKANSAEEFVRQRVAQGDATIQEMKKMIEDMDVRAAVEEAREAEENMKNLVTDAKVMVEEWRNAGNTGGKQRPYRKHKEPNPFRPQAKGAEGQFKSWSFTFAGHMEGLNPGMEEFLDWISKQEDECAGCSLIPAISASTSSFEDCSLPKKGFLQVMCAAPYNG